MSVLLALGIVLITAAAQAQMITGTVRDAQTGPMQSMVVSVYTPAGMLQANATTDVNGRYEITVSTGTYRVLAYDPAGAYATQFGNDAPSFEESPQTVVGAGQTVTINFSLVRGGSVSGVVLTSDGIRPDLTVAAYNPSGTRRGFTVTSSTGQYSLVLPPGKYKIAAYDETGAFVTSFFNDKTSFFDADPITVDAGQAVPSIDLFLVLGSRVSGKVTDAERTPLANVSVLVYSASGTYITLVTTALDGTFALTIAPGTYRFVAIDTSFTYAAGFLNGASSFESSSAITVSAGQSRSDLSFPLERGGLVEGSAIDAATGSGIRGIIVAAYNVDGTMRTFTTTDANGLYVLLLPSGNFRIAAFDVSLIYATQFYNHQNSFAQSVAITATPGQTVILQPFVLSHGGRVSGVVMDQATGARIVGATVAAYGADGNLVAWTTTSSAGTYRLLLPPGQYRLIGFDSQLRYAPAYSGGGASFDTSTPISVTADTETTADLALPRGTIVSGRVADDAQGGIGGIEITALDPDQMRVASATTKADGSFQIALSPGTYRFVAVDPTGRYRMSYFGGSTFASATAVSVGTSTPPRVTIVIELPGRRRAAHH